MLIIRENFHKIFYKINKFTIFFNKNLVIYFQAKYKLVKCKN